MYYTYKSNARASHEYGSLVCCFVFLMVELAVFVFSPVAASGQNLTFGAIKRPLLIARHSVLTARGLVLGPNQLQIPLAGQGTSELVIEESLFFLVTLVELAEPLKTLLP